MRGCDRRLTELERLTNRGRLDPAGDLDEDEVLAEWRELSRTPRSPSSLPPEIARLSDAEAVDMARRLIRGGLAELQLEARVPPARPGGGRCRAPPVPGRAHCVFGGDVNACYRTLVRDGKADPSIADELEQLSSREGAVGQAA
jgi:hypothetical protein